MAKGTVKWFNEERGFGFIKPDAGGRDIFFHASAVRNAEATESLDGMTVVFDVHLARGKEVADNLRVV